MYTFSSIGGIRVAQKGQSVLSQLRSIRSQWEEAFPLQARSNPETISPSPWRFCCVVDDHRVNRLVVKKIAAHAGRDDPSMLPTRIVLPDIS